MAELAGQASEVALSLARSQPHGQAGYLLYTAVSNALLLAHPALRRGAAELEAAGQRHAQFVGPLVEYLAGMATDPSLAAEPDMHAEQLGYSLRCLAAVVRAVDGEARAIKQASTTYCATCWIALANRLPMTHDGMLRQLCHASIAPALPAVLACLQVYATSSHVLQPVMDFLLAIFVSIRTQVDKAFIDDTIGCFLRICEGDAMLALVSGPYGQPSVMSKFLSLLTALVIPSPPPL